MLRPPTTLAPECIEFQSGYERGQRDEHLERCEDCRQFVAFVDGLRELGLSTPLEDGLRAKLRALPLEQDGIPAFPRVPQLPLPAALAARLRRIARDGVREALPIWIRSPRYAIAASYLLTLLIGGTLGNPAAWASQAGGPLSKVETALHSVRDNGREAWNGIEETATENFSNTKEFLRASRASLRARWLELVESFDEQETQEREQPSSETPDEADGASDAVPSI